MALILTLIPVILAILEHGVSKAMLQLCQDLYQDFTEHGSGSRP